MLSLGGAFELREKLQTVSQTWDTAVIVESLAGLLRQQPANIVALTCIGLLAFCGDPLTFRHVKEQNVIPMDLQGEMSLSKMPTFVDDLCRVDRMDPWN